MKNKWILTIQCLVIFLIILVFKLWYFSNNINFEQDIARDLIIAESNIKSGNFLIGYGPKASVGNFYLAPFYYQLFLIVSLLTNHQPFAMAIVTMLVESVTPVILWLILRRLIKSQLAVVLAVCYGLSPIPTIFSTFSWNPNMVPFFSTLILYCAIKYLETKKDYLFGFIFLSATIAIHLHYQAVLLVPFILIFSLVMLFKRPSLWKTLLLSCLISLLTLSPYFWAEINNHWQNTLAIKNYFTKEHSNYYDRVSKINFVISFLPGVSERVLVKNNFNHLYLGRAIYLFGFACLFWQILRAKKKQLYFLVLSYFFLIFLMLRIYKGDKIDYYLSTLYILPVILLALIAKTKKILAVLLLSLIFFTQGKFYATVSPSNEWKSQNILFEQINQDLEGKKVFFVFHDDDQINTFTYFIHKKSRFTLTKDADYLVEIANNLNDLALSPYPACSKKQTQSYASMLKNNQPIADSKTYQLENRIFVSISKINLKPVDYPYILYPTDSRYGNDFLDLEIYNP